MSKLKTLKDIAQPFDMTAELLRAEAVRCYKSIEDYEGNIFVKDFIEWFFNLTEEDLK